MITITGKGLANLLKDFDKKSFASIHAITEPKLNKKGRNSGLSFKEIAGVEAANVRKVSDMVIGLGYDYEQLIAHRLINKEGKTGEEYQRGQSWHEPWEGSTTIHKKINKEIKELERQYRQAKEEYDSEPKDSVISCQKLQLMAKLQESIQELNRKTKDDELYLFVACIANNPPNSMFVDITTGVEIDKDLLVEFLPKEDIPENQGFTITPELKALVEAFKAGYTLTESEVEEVIAYLKKLVIVRTFKLDSIRQLKVSGEVYEVEVERS
jgi:hypothetical protein